VSEVKRLRFELARKERLEALSAEYAATGARDYAEPRLTGGER
jgi:hypothetical protein